MSDLTDAGRQIVTDLAARYGLSAATVEQMARAVAAGGGTMAQFDLAELGGSGQWMAGGMTMVGDMFNHGLKATVDGLCGELAAAMAQTPVFRAPVTVAGTAWWPEELGTPTAVGGQNRARYAYFPQARRIAFDPGDGQPVVLLDTLDHRIGGFSQQQSGPGDPFAGITFSSQLGQHALASLPRVGAPRTSESGLPREAPAAHGPAAEAAPAADAVVPSAGAAPGGGQAVSAEDILSTIERLAKLRDAGALTEEEFAGKKAELLRRL